MLIADDLLREFNETTECCIAESSKAVYQSRYNNYLKIIASIPGADPPEPVTEKNLKLFLVKRQKDGLSYNTIVSEISAIGYYCRKNSWADVTQESFVKEFKKGLMRKLQTGVNPHASDPIKKEDLIKMIEVANLEKKTELETAAHIIIQFLES